MEVTEKKTKENKKNNFGGLPGPGRPKGVPNKVTTEIKEMVLSALSNVGGIEYLEVRARENPVAFLSLIAKIIPLQVNGAGTNGEHILSVIERKIIDPGK